MPKGAEKTGGGRDEPPASAGSVYKLKSRSQLSEMDRIMMEESGGSLAVKPLEKKKVSVVIS